MRERQELITTDGGPLVAARVNVDEVRAELRRQQLYELQVGVNENPQREARPLSPAEIRAAAVEATRNLKIA